MAEKRSRKIFVDVAVRDLKKSMEFLSALGFNQKFTSAAGVWRERPLGGQLANQHGRLMDADWLQYLCYGGGTLGFSIRDLLTALGRREKPRRIQNESQFRRDMDEGREQRTEKTEGGQPDPERIDDKRAGEVLPDDTPGAAGDDEGFDEAGEIVPEQHHVCALARNVRA